MKDIEEKLIRIKNWCLIFLYILPKSYVRDFYRIFCKLIKVLVFPSNKNILMLQLNIDSFKYNRLFEKKMLKNGK